MKRSHVPRYMWREAKYRWKWGYRPQALALLKKIQQDVFRRT